MDEALEALLEKLRRAAQHARDFMDSYQPWHHGDPYRVVCDFEPHPTKPDIEKRCWSLELTREPPLAYWAALTGELLYQLRSVLEHLAYAAASRDSHPYAPPSGVGFPIFLKRNKYEQAGVHGAEPRLAGMSDTVRALIKELQPFDPGWDGEPRKHPLWLLHELSDTDRHESPHIAAGFARLGNIQVGQRHNVEVLAFRPREGPFEDGAKIATATVRWLDPVDAEVHVNLSLGPQIAFSVPGRAAQKPYAGLPVLRTLADIHGFVVRQVFYDRLGHYLFPDEIIQGIPLPADIHPPWIVYQ